MAQGTCRGDIGDGQSPGRWRGLHEGSSQSVQEWISKVDQEGMKRLENCIHKGGISCRNHGGSGSAFHEGGYVHPYLSKSEIRIGSISEGEGFEVLQKRNVEITALESEFDDDAAISMLGIVLNKSISSAISERDLLMKSFFDFDLVTAEGLIKFLNLLPLIDFDIVKEVMEAVWPAYPTDGLNSSTARMELKGFILDYLNQLDQEELVTTGSDDSE